MTAILYFCTKCRP